MASLDWKQVVGALAPTIGTALGGPLAGSAVKVLADTVLGNTSATDKDVAQAITAGLTPEQMAAVQKAENDYALRLRELDLDAAKLNQDMDRAYVEDTASARTTNSGDEKVFWLGLGVLLIFFVLMAIVLWGCFAIATGELRADSSVIAVVTGLIGTVVGYVAANAQQVVSYFFGSSKGSKDSAGRLSDALTTTLGKLGNKTA